MYTASFDHALKVEFVGANDVSPLTEGTSSGHKVSQKAAPLRTITYKGLWDNVTLVYEKDENSVHKSTYYIAPSSNQKEFTAKAQSTQRKEIKLCNHSAGSGYMPESAEEKYIKLCGLCDFPPGHPPDHVFRAGAVRQPDRILAGTGAVNVVDQIRLRYNVPVQIDQSGNLVLTFKTGQFIESPPVAWQEIDGKRVYVDVVYSRLGEREIGFKAGHYDASLPLIIDPALTWNTFLGGSGIDYGYGIAVDTSGNVYVSGSSFATWGSPVTDYSSGEDAFAAKLNGSGSLTWSTFLGGSGSDRGYGIDVDSSGNVYVTGSSSAAWGSPITAYGGGATWDAFAAKLDGSDGSLTWHTFLGGSNSDHGSEIAVDTNVNANVYVAGYSYASWGSPVTAHGGGGLGMHSRQN